MSNQERNEWGLPVGMTPHNPDNLTPEQITEGGKYRPLAKCEVDEKYHEVKDSGYWRGGTWSHCCDNGGWWWGEGSTIRVPADTPLPAQSTPQPAPSYGEPLDTQGYNASGRWVLDSTDPATLRRAVECWNACAGIADPEKAIQAAREALDKIMYACYKGSPMELVKNISDAADSARAALAQLSTTK